MNQWIIVGDPVGEKHKGCLVLTLGVTRKEQAEEALADLIDPESKTHRVYESSIKGMENLRLKEVDERDCWWSRWGLD